MKTHDAPFWTTDGADICPVCNADRQALFLLARAQENKTVPAQKSAYRMIMTCAACCEAWEKEG